MSIDAYEWLDKAKRLAIGAKARIRHTGESRDNLMIYNNLDNWSCWCYACNAGSKVPKQYVELIAEVLPTKGRTVPLPYDCVPLADVSASTVRRVYTYLLTRGIDPASMLNDMSVLVSENTQRLCLEMNGGGYVGRGIVGQKIKAITYSDKPFTQYATHPKDSTDFIGLDVVLTEDYLSCLKVRHCTSGYQAISVQGSNAHVSLVAKLLKCKSVSIMLDGDDAGRKGSAKIWRTLKSFIKEVRIINTPEGKDPKDLHGRDIRRLLDGNDS